MNIIRNDKVVLVKEFEGMTNVGATYEVANVTDSFVVLRDITNKIAAGAIDLRAFDRYFKKRENVKGWTKWQGISDPSGNLFAFYRTNFKHVEVRMMTSDSKESYRARATCCKEDNFHLSFGIRLAYARCMDKVLNKLECNYQEKLKQIQSEIAENKNQIKKMLHSLDENEEQDRS